LRSVAVSKLFHPLLVVKASSKAIADLNNVHHLSAFRAMLDVFGGGTTSDCLVFQGTHHCILK
jgi:hypothetical protein